MFFYVFMICPCMSLPAVKFIYTTYSCTVYDHVISIIFDKSLERCLVIVNHFPFIFFLLGMKVISQSIIKLSDFNL